MPPCGVSEQAAEVSADSATNGMLFLGQDTSQTLPFGEVFTDNPVIDMGAVSKMLELAAGAGLVGATGFAAWALGHWCLGSRWNFQHPALKAASSTAFGLIILSYLIFALTQLHLVSTAALTLLLSALAVIALIVLLGTAWRKGRLQLEGLRQQSKGFWITLSVASIYVAWILLCVVLPPTALDELVYHLAVSRKLLAANGAILFPDNIYAYFPQLGEMFFLFGLAVGGEVAARLFHVLFGLLLALALYGFSRKYLSSRFSVLSVALFFSIPSVMVILPTAYVDLTFALYAFLALAALLEYFERGEWKWVIAAGVMVGGTLATKYTGLQFLLFLTLLILTECLRSKRRELLAATAILAASALPFLIPYLWRNWYFTGWPLFPFQLGIFELHQGINWDPERSRLFLRWLSLFGTTLGQESLWDRVLAPLLVFIKARFGSTLHYEGVVGPVFLLTPFLLLRARKPPAVRLFILFSLIFFYYWAFTTLQIRFLIPILAVLSFLLAFGLARFKNQILSGIIALLMIVSLSMGVRKVWELKPLPFWLGRETRQQYLRRVVIAYPLYEKANQRVGPEDRLLLVNMRNFGYYLNCPWTSDFIFEFYQLHQFLSAEPASQSLASFFSSRAVTHLMIDEDITYSEFALEPEQSARVKDYLAGSAQLLAREQGRALYKLVR